MNVGTLNDMINARVGSARSLEQCEAAFADIAAHTLQLLDDPRFEEHEESFPPFIVPREMSFEHLDAWANAFRKWSEELPSRVYLEMQREEVRWA